MGRSVRRITTREGHRNWRRNLHNVGGPILDAAIQHLRLRGRIALYGRISQTAASALYGVRNTGLLIGMRGRMDFCRAQ